MAQVTLNFDNGKWEDVKDAYAARWSIPKDENGNNLFTKAAWFKEILKSQIRQIVAEHKKRIADQANPYQEDPDLVS